jgi:hypothetical protein
VYEVKASKYAGGMSPNYGAVVSILHHDIFRREHGFSKFDFLPANRMVPLEGDPSVDLGLLRSERVEQERMSLLDQSIQYRSATNLAGVGSYLATLDYQSHLMQRQGMDLPDEYERLTSPFGAATGKALLRPQFDPERGAGIEVELPSGQRHGLPDLSSGEQELLAMMYFLRRVAVAGGVLCLDEPEQHLHPTLQAALLDVMASLTERAQLLLTGLRPSPTSHAVAGWGGGLRSGGVRP